MEKINHEEPAMDVIALTDGVGGIGISGGDNEIEFESLDLDLDRKFYTE